MTLALDPVIPQTVINVGHSVPAAALTDRRLAEWARAHGVSVTVCDDEGLNAVQRHRIRPFQVVCRCGPVTAISRRAVGLGVRRFIVDTAHQMARLDECAANTLYLYLDDRAPLMLGDRRLKVIGLHADVQDGGTGADWATAARALVRRAAILQACGSSVQRIALSGGPTGGLREDWLRALDLSVWEECQEQRIPLPRVTVLTRP